MAKIRNTFLVTASLLALLGYILTQSNLFFYLVCFTFPLALLWEIVD